MPGGRPRQTICRKGLHPLDGDNVVMKDGTRHCRACLAERARTRSRRIYDAFYRSPYKELGIKRPDVRRVRLPASE